MGCFYPRTSKCQEVIDNFYKENPAEDTEKKYGPRKDFFVVLIKIEEQTNNYITKLSKVEYFEKHTCSLKNSECQAWVVSAEFENKEIENHIWTVKIYHKADEETIVSPGNTIVKN